MRELGDRVEEEVVDTVRTEKEEGVATPSVPEDIEAFLNTKIDELRHSIRDAVQEALANALGDLLEEKEEDERRNVETEAEELPRCPKNISWLQKMFELLPLDILKHSKLWRYRHCVVAVKEVEKEAEQ